MELTIQTEATAAEVLNAIALRGIVIDFARAGGVPVDVGPLRELAERAALAGTESDPTPGQSDPRPIPGVDLTERAGEIAVAAGLTAEDFVGCEPSGRTGYTVADVEAILAARGGK